MRKLKRMPVKIPIKKIIRMFWTFKLNGTWECNQCGFVAKTIAGVGKHMKQIHNIYTQRK